MSKSAGGVPPYSTCVKSAGTSIGGTTTFGGFPPLRNYVRGWPGVVRRRSRAGWRARATVPRRCARTIENISRIRMVVARASGTDLASSLKRNTFWTKAIENVSRIRTAPARASETVTSSSLKRNKLWAKLLLRWLSSACQCHRLDYCLRCRIRDIPPAFGRAGRGVPHLCPFKIATVNQKRIYQPLAHRWAKK